MRSMKRGGKRRFKYTDRKKLSKKENKKLKRKLAKPTQNEIVGKEWNAEKTVKQNLERMGLAYDPNKAIGSENKTIMEVDIETGDLSTARAEGSIKKQRLKKKQEKKVVSKLEEFVLEKEEKIKPVAPSISKQDVMFYNKMIAKHGLDYAAISRDPENIWQLTPNQIRRKLTNFKKSESFQSAMEKMEVEA